MGNRIPAAIHDQIIELALELSELSPRELAVRFNNEVDAQPGSLASYRGDFGARMSRAKSRSGRGMYNGNLGWRTAAMKERSPTDPMASFSHWSSADRIIAIGSEGDAPVIAAVLQPNIALCIPPTD